MPPTNLGATGLNLWTTTPTMTLTTTAAAPAGDTIAVLISYWRQDMSESGRLVTGVSDGAAYSLANRTINANGQNVIEIWVRHAPAGLALGASITATNAGVSNIGSMVIAAASFPGIDPASPVVATGGSNSQTGTGWTSGTVSNAGSPAATIFGGSANSTAAAATSAPASGTEIHDYRFVAEQHGTASGYIDAETEGTRAITGTFSSTSAATTGVVVALRKLVAPPPSSNADGFVRVGGAWVPTDRQARAGGKWV